MTQFQRILPRLDALNEAFWTGGKNGLLRILQCQDCDHYLHPPGPVCPKCFGRNMEPQSVSGKGKLFSFTINAKPWAPGMDVPYVVAIVELEEQAGLRLETNIINAKLEDIVIGMPVEVVFEQDEDIFLPMFQPASAS